MATPQPRFLVVDDDPVIRVLVATVLDELGPVDVAEDGVAALRHLVRHPVDVLVLDVMMPGLSGLQVLAGIRADAGLQDLPVLLLSARDQQIDHVHGYRAGADAYVTKPFDTELLLLVAQGLLQDRHAVRDGLTAGFGPATDLAPLPRPELESLAGTTALRALTTR